MNDFDQRWQELAAQARRASPPPADDPAPAGFATRVVARAKPVASPDWDDLWLRWARQSLAFMTACGALMLVLEFSARRPPTLGRTGVENTVAQVLWKL